MFAIDRPGDLRLRYLEYEPGASVLARVSVNLEPDTFEVVVSQGCFDPRDQSILHLLDVTDTRVPGGRAAAEDEHSGLLATWHPHDPALPALALTGTQLAERLALPEPDSPEPESVEQLGWVPGRRAVLRVGNHIVKLHGSAAAAEDAATRARLVAARLDTATPIAVHPELGIVVSLLVPGATPSRLDAGVHVAAVGAALQRLHRPVGGDLPRFGAVELWAQAVVVARRVAHLLPAMAPRIDDLCRALDGHRPPGDLEVAIHGDFNVGQLVVRPDGKLFVIDTDTLAVGPAAIDVAAYVANLLSGRPGDLVAALGVRDELVAHYGRRPDGLDWYVAACGLRRLDRPFRRAKRRWPRRVATMVDDLEAIAATLADRR